MDKEVRRHSGVLKVAAAAGVFAILVPSLASAGGTPRVRVQGKVAVKGTVTSKVKDTAGGRVNSRNIPAYGTFGAPGSSGAVDVWQLEGAFLGYVDNVAATPFPNTFTIPAAGGTGELHRLVVMESPNTGGAMDCEIVISTDAIESSPGSPVPLLEADFTAPEVVEAPLRLTDDLHITVTGNGAVTGTNCAVGIVGIVPESAL